MGFTADIAGIIPLLAAVRSSAVSISATQRRLSSQLECFSASRSILAFLIEEMISSQLMTKQHVCMTVSVINHKALLLIIGWTETKNSFLPSLTFYKVFIYLMQVLYHLQEILCSRDLSLVDTFHLQI